ncbi:MAG: MYG1 family protein [Chlamydiota bacterium]
MIATKLKRSLGTHSGVFHSDEVTSCALLLLFDLIDADKIVRTRQQVELEGCEYICDVGGVYDPDQKAFDHHQATYTGPMSSAGMILSYLHDEGVIEEEDFNFFYDNLIRGVDDHDNGRVLDLKGHMSFSDVVENFNPPQYSAGSDERDKAFRKALDFVYGHLDRMWRRRQDIRASYDEVKKVMESSEELLLFEREVPWQECFFGLGGEGHPGLFIIMPCEGQWKLRGIPPSGEEPMKVRQPLPNEWAGLLGEDLRRASGIEGAVFCHKGLFISIWKSKDAALQAYNYIMKKRR